MAKIKFTEEQQEIIRARDCNILVSAAAGSGKTAVLVERILNRVMDPDHPVDVDRFVIVTFTRAAAAQMKNRLRDRLEKALQEDPGNAYLQRQTSLVSSAHISTVHSFCGYVIQNYFHRIGLDPAYRQGTESELGLLKQETIDEILEREYEEERDDFMAFAGMQMFNRSDAKMADLVFELYSQAVSEPFPYEWIKKMEESLQPESEEAWENSAFVRSLLADCAKLVEGMQQSLAGVQKVCMEPVGPYYFDKHMEELENLFEELLTCRTYTDWRNVTGQMKFSVMRGKKDGAVNPDKKAYVADFRNACKDELKKMQEQYFSMRVEECMEQQRQMAAPVLTLLRLTREFMEAFTQAKRDRGIVDFTDLEQLSLQILVETDPQTGEHKRSQAALELSDFFEEIMIDEYQDSNRVQDTILGCVSRDGRADHAPNLFMVGDVKQSIYRFRRACPELFSEKLSSYSVESGASSRRIDLHQNFRSRACVLAAANQVFERVMHADIGGVEYDEDARLRTGRVFADTQFRTEDTTSGAADAPHYTEDTASGAADAPHHTEDTAPGTANAPFRTADSTDLHVVVSDTSATGAEAREAVNVIRDLMREDDSLCVSDKNEQDEEIFRPVRYSDIVILVRSVRSIGQEIFDVLTEAGIPVVMERTQGFFDTREIRLMTSILQVVDNPRQDFPLAAVLAGPMFGFTSEELAHIRVQSRDRTLYESLEIVTDEGLKDKIDHFLAVLNRLREKISYATVAELMEDIYTETGIYDSIRMMSDGAQRAANMDRLMEIAREFDETTYHGLYQFVRYIERIREQEEEVGEVNIVGEEENVVRIMTIHKSKGLEFPVAILMGMGKKLSHASRSFLTIHPELGIAAPLCDSEKHTKKDTMYRSFLERKNRMEDLGEELRVLYVAMTRAEEKLILIGTTSEKKLVGTGSSYWDRSRIDSYLEMVFAPALAGRPEFRFTAVPKEELVEEAVQDLAEEKIDLAVLNNFDTDIRYHEGIHELLVRMEMDAMEEAEPLPVKVSVSDLKVRSMEETEASDFTILTHDDTPEEMPVPAFVKEKTMDAGHQGAAYGTIWHQVMATIDFAKTGSEAELQDAVADLVEAGKMRTDETGVLNYRRLLAFFKSDLGNQMKQAAAEGRLHREQPFVIRRPACDIFPERTEKDPVLIQGIIDGFYDTEDGIVLMDYKTDSLKPGQEEKLIERYQTQMELYRDALEEVFHRKVISCVLYSFSLGKEIRVPL